MLDAPACHPACRWLDLAAGLRDLGYRGVLPMLHDGDQKRPAVAWSEFQVDPPTDRHLYADWWPNVWERARGVQLVAGKPYGFVVVDADDETSWAWALANLPAVRGVKTRPGGHLHFRHPPRGIMGNRSGQRALELAPGIRVDVKGLAGLAVAPLSLHPAGHGYAPVGDWTCPLDALPVLPESVARLAEDRPPAPAPPPRARRADSRPADALAAYLSKVGGIPAERTGSDHAVFRAASWAKANAPELREEEFIDAIRRERPEFSESWVRTKWRSARGR